MEELLVCGRCCGEGRQSWVEDDRWVEDVCYACGGSGSVDAEHAFEQRLGAALDLLGRRKAHAYRCARDEDPEGEDFAFCAAENMLSARDYEEALAMDYSERASRETRDWSRERLEWLVALSEWSWRSPRAVSAEHCRTSSWEDRW